MFESGSDAYHRERWTQARLFYFCGALLGDRLAGYGLERMRRESDSLARVRQSPVVAASPTAAPARTPAATTSALTVDEFQKAFKNDPAGAETLTKRVKRFMLTGTVGWIGADFATKAPAIELRGSGPVAVACTFPDSEKGAVNALRVGQKVTIRAEFSLYANPIIGLKNCEVVR